jgi:hypothetical protein
MYSNSCWVVTLETLIDIFDGYEAQYKQCVLLAESFVPENLLPWIHTVGVIQHKFASTAERNAFLGFMLLDPVRMIWLLHLLLHEHERIFQYNSALPLFNILRDKSIHM